MDKDVPQGFNGVGPIHSVLTIMVFPFVMCRLEKMRERHTAGRQAQIARSSTINRPRP
jgi:hypothetical protein